MQMNISGHNYEQSVIKDLTSVDMLASYLLQSRQQILINSTYVNSTDPVTICLLHFINILTN